MNTDPAARFQHSDWATVPIERVADGVELQTIYGERLMVCRLRVAPHTVAPVHSHFQEQMVLVERGRAVFIVEGQERAAVAGDVLHLASNVPHGVTVLDEEVVLFSIFSPVREGVGSHLSERRV